MSVLVKGMEMPKTCDECEFHCYHSYGEYVCVAAPLLYPFNLANCKGRRKDWCPLVDVPAPHGDLIDKSQIKVVELEDSVHFMRWERNSEVDFRIEAPTVIEAEETE